ncbi:MAG: hypothetical protein K2H90_02730 [Oscillospiraceae bacterium]|nr:hypothetical protein [Oscillospiraceae bacterium]
MIEKSKEEILEQIKKRGVKKSYLCDLIGGYRGKLTEWEKGKTTLTKQELEIITDYLFDENNLQAEAIALYSKYSRLSPEQRRLVDGMFEQFEKKK